MQCSSLYMSEYAQLIRSGFAGRRQTEISIRALLTCKSSTNFDERAIKQTKMQ